MVNIDRNITRHEEIDQAVAVIVRPCRAGAKTTHSQTGLLGYIFELTVPLIAIKHIPTEARDINILPSIVIKIHHRYAHSPALFCQPCRLRNIGKLQTCVLMVERDHGIAALAIPIDRRSVDGDYVELAVVITVDEANAAAHRFNDVPFFWGGVVETVSPACCVMSSNCGILAAGDDWGTLSEEGNGKQNPENDAQLFAMGTLEFYHAQTRDLVWRTDSSGTKWSSGSSAKPQLLRSVCRVLRHRDGHPDASNFVTGQVQHPEP